MKNASKKVFIFSDNLSEDEQNLISKNCNKSLIFIVNHDSTSKTNLLVQENRNQTCFVNIENVSNQYVKIDSKCEWWLQGKNYMTLHLEDVPKETTSFEIILENTENNGLFFGLTLEILNYDEDIDEFDNWYIAVGKEVHYTGTKKIRLGIVARVSEGWKFYPRFEGISYDEN